jgi:hypothetical protein
MLNQNMTSLTQQNPRGFKKITKNSQNAPKKKNQA